MAPIIESALSLVFVFLLLSLIASWTNELFSGKLGLRGKHLRRHLSKALDDRFNQKNWGEMVYTHPCIDLLARRNAKPPAYIPPDLFAIALIDIIADEARQTSFVQDAGTLAIQPHDSWIGTTEAASPVEKFKAGLKRMKDSDVKQLLEAMVLHNPDELEGLKVNIINWYNNYMDRLTGWYKRKIRLYLFWIGLGMAVLGNVDTVRLINALYYNPQTREATLRTVEKYLAQNPSRPVVNHILPLAPDPKATVLSTRELEQRIYIIDSVYKELDTLKLPIGWKKHQSIWSQLQAANLWWRLLGWLLTAFAISFGAPFWFDTLKYLVNVRNTGVRPSTDKYVITSNHNTPK